MQAIMESLFDIAYFILVITLGIKILKRAKGQKQFVLFGLMAIVLGCGDAFHLLPRIWAINTTGIENHAAALGFGTFVTSITMTVFYVLFYHVWRFRYKINGKIGLTVAIYALVIVRIGLCLFPQNGWLNANAPVSWGIYRNIPFAVLGVMIIILYAYMAKKHNDHIFRFMWLAVTLSFAFYIPVVLFTSVVPIIGMLMIPKTVAYLWMMWMGYQDSQHF